MEQPVEGIGMMLLHTARSSFWRRWAVPLPRLAISAHRASSNLRNLEVRGSRLVLIDNIGPWESWCQLRRVGVLRMALDVLGFLALRTGFAEYNGVNTSLCSGVWGIRRYFQA
jgi:hypothetical protein